VKVYVWSAPQACCLSALARFLNCFSRRARKRSAMQTEREQEHVRRQAAATQDTIRPSPNPRSFASPCRVALRMNISKRPSGSESSVKLDLRFLRLALKLIGKRSILVSSREEAEPSARSAIPVKSIDSGSAFSNHRDVSCVLTLHMPPLHVFLRQFVGVCFCYWIVMHSRRWLMQVHL
jgi:hypothetical protein